MSDPNTPPPVPNVALATTPPGQPDGADADEQTPVSSPAAAIESILRQPRRIARQLGRPGPGRLIVMMAVVTVVCSLTYGVVVGAFSGGAQLWAAPIKVAAGLLLSVVICLPSLYIFSCLGGSTARLGEVAGLIMGLAMLMTILLIGFAPVAWIFSQSTESVMVMGVLHLAFWSISAYFGLRFLSAGFTARKDCSGGGIKVWMVIFVLVMLQMTTAMRPLIGTAETFLPTQKQFFVSHWLDCLKLNRDSESNRNGPETP